MWFHLFHDAVGGRGCHGHILLDEDMFHNSGLPFVSTLPLMASCTIMLP
jgi:hypothetical protein